MIPFIQLFPQRTLLTIILSTFSIVLYAQQSETAFSGTSDETEVKKNGFLLTFVVDENNMPLVVQIDITDNSTGQVVQKFECSRIGYSRVSLPSGSYNAVFSKEGYLFFSTDFEIPDSAGFEKKLKKIVLKKVEAGNDAVLNSISFEQNKSTLKESSFKDLDRVIQMLNQIVTLEIEIEGNVDDESAVKTQKELSEQRAQVVINYLVSKGVDRKRLKYRGYQDPQPIELLNAETIENVATGDKVKMKVVSVDGVTQETVKVENPVVAKQEGPVSVEEVKKEDVEVAKVEEAVKQEEPVDEPQKESVEVERKEEIAKEEELANQQQEIATTKEPKKEENQSVAETVVKEPEPQPEIAKTEDVNISFEQNKSELKDISFKNLDNVIAMLNQVVTLEIEIEGNTSTETSVKSPKELADQRAQVVINYLVSKGVDRNRLIYRGYQDTQPIELVSENGRGNQKVKLKVVGDDVAVEESVQTEVAATQEEVAPVAEQIKEDVTTDKKEEEKVEEKIEDKVEDVVQEQKQEEKKENTIEQTNNEAATAENITKQQEDTVVTTKTEELQTKATEEETAVTTNKIGADINGMGMEINSQFPDYAPFVTADGSVMVFTSRRPLNKKDIEKNRIGKDNIYISCYDNKTKKWQDAMLLEAPVNTADKDNVAIGLSADGQKMYIYRNTGEEQVVTGDIYESQLRGDLWTEPEKLPAPINTESNETSASLSADGRTLYFVSDRKGSVGGKDIWLSTKNKNEKWGEAINIGADVNSTEDEECVFIHPNGNVLFFSSKGHQSTGGFDIYMSTLDEVTGKWGKPVNLGDEINTTNDDMYFVMTANGKTAYYASFEANGKGGNDIYHIDFTESLIKKNTVVLKGSVIDEHGRFLKAKITYADQVNGKPIGLLTSNRVTGKYIVPLPAGKNYDVKFSANGYTSFVEPIDAKGLSYSEFSKIILLESKNSYISGKVVDSRGGVVNAVIEVIDKANKQTVEKIVNSEEEDWRIAVPPGKNYYVTITKPGYFFYTTTLKMPNSIGYERNMKTISLDKIEQGKKKVLENVLFETDKAILKQELFSDLDFVVKMLVEMPTLQIEISDNANGLSKDKKKQQLSKDRSKAVYDYLVSNGCDAKRIKYTSRETKEPIPAKQGEQSGTSIIELRVIKINAAQEQASAENRMKEIQDALNLQKENDTFGEIDSMAIDEEYIEEPAVSEYEEMDTTGFASTDSLGTESDSMEMMEEEPTAVTADTILLQIQRMGLSVNSPFSDYAPVINADGSNLFFTSGRPVLEAAVKQTTKGKQPIKQNKENIYYTSYSQIDERWQPVMLLKAVNLTDVNNTVLALSNDGQRMLLCRTVGDAAIKGDIMESILTNGEWSTPATVLSAVNNNSSNETSASYSPDGRTIYFVSDRIGGAGQKDIWYCTQNERGAWGEAVNLGDPVNTDKDEESVYMHPNGSTLFFSSKGHNTTGGYDIYMADYNDSLAAWETPRNLGEYINTPDDDLHFVLAADGKTGYYSAVRTEGLGKEDIYRVLSEKNILAKNTLLLKGAVVDEFGKGIRAKITLKEKASGKIVGSYTSQVNTGSYFISLPLGKNYEIKVNAPEHTTYTRTIDLVNKERYEEMVKNIVLENKNALINTKVFDENGVVVSKVQVEVIDRKAKQLIEKTETDSDGYLSVAVPSDKKMDILFRKPGYLFQSVSVVTPKSVGGKEYQKDLKTITLQKLDVGRKTVLSNVTFEYNQAVIKQEAFIDLARVVSMLNTMPSLQIEISDHTDNQKLPKNLQKLSSERAKAVANRLVEMGADKKRIRYKSYGDKQPIASNSTEEERAKNRRVELKIIKIDAKAEQEAEEKRLQEELAAEAEPQVPYSEEPHVEVKKGEVKEEANEVVQETPKQEEPAAVLETREEVKEEVREEPKEEVKEEVNEVVQETPKQEEPIAVVETKEEVKEEVREEPKEEANEVVQETPKQEEPVPVVETREEVKEEIQEEPKEEVKEEASEVVQEAPKQEAPKQEAPVAVIETKEEVKEEIREEPKEEVKEESNEVVQETPKQEEPVAVIEVKEEQAVKKMMPTTSSLSERHRKYDSDKDGTLSYKEIIGAIDSYFDNDPDVTADDINAMIDAFFN